jgi:hypothetical protein
MVRMLFDPSLVDRVTSDAEVALEGLDLSARERAQLLAVDRRAWGYDPLRRRRTLRNLAEEFKGTTTLLLAATRSLASIERFFSSSEFHSAVQERGSMALAFADYLGRYEASGIDLPPQLGDIWRLETLLARTRRDRRRPARCGSGEVALPPRHGVVALNANVVAAHNQVDRYLFEVGLMPAVALCDDAPRLPCLPAVVEERIYLLAYPVGSGVTLTAVGADEYAVLRECGRDAIRVAELVRQTEAAGLEAERAREVISTLLDEGLLLGSAG